MVATAPSGASVIPSATEATDNKSGDSMAIVQPTDEGFRAYRRLALRVLAQAFRDLANPARSSHRESARVFLGGSAMMIHWCEVAALDPLCIVTHAKQLMACPGWDKIRQLERPSVSGRPEDLHSHPYR